MTFERGIWRGAYDNARVNIWLLLMITAAIFVLYLASDLGRLKSGGSFSIIIWAYLAIPAHFTALTSMRALFADVELDTIRKVMDINFWGTVYCTKFALPYFG